jgi:hypothetical protein
MSVFSKDYHNQIIKEFKENKIENKSDSFSYLLENELY